MRSAILNAEAATKSGIPPWEDVAGPHSTHIPGQLQWLLIGPG
jgi:hypothetical protein